MKTMKVAIIGFGSVGKGVLKVLAESKGIYNDVEFKVVAITDSKGAVLDNNGLDLETDPQAKGQWRPEEGE